MKQKNLLAPRCKTLGWLVLGATLSLALVDVALAEGQAQTLGTLASNVTGSLGQIAKLLIAGAFVAGMGFAVGAVLKFKQHKDNPTQIPVGTPIALVFIAAALMFLPSIFSSLGQTVFGAGASKGTISGESDFIGGGGGGGGGGS
jgi:intracellular multiplication protein IcmD